jgi:hypothetical protein
VALAFPVVDGRDLHPRFYRQMAPFQSILTFDIQVPPEDFALMGLEKKNGRLGIWHGRVTKMPAAQHVEEWSAKEVAKATLLLKRLVRGVGHEHYEVNEDKDGSSLRIFRWATTSELAAALRTPNARKDKRPGGATTPDA